MSFADTFKALSDPARRQILELLKRGPLSAGDIGSHFDMTGATISYHLKVLRQADLVIIILTLCGAASGWLIAVFAVIALVPCIYSAWLHTAGGL